ncbi:glycosyltransferase [Bacteroidota bacterium]
MSFAGAYLEKVGLDPVIDRQTPSPDLTIVVAIPACNEPDLMKSLHALRKCSAPQGAVEIIVALNSSKSAPQEVITQNLISEDEIRSFSGEYSDPMFRVLFTHKREIREKLAGAGYARKIAMDHALSRFNRLGNPEGIILSLDADTICEPDYFSSVEEHFGSKPGIKACSIYFEHPLSGTEFPDRVYFGITLYELHLRYYIQGLRYAGHPHAFHTVGSAFGIRSGVYASQGGMNKRTAGEDFYFLQKIIPLGYYHDLNSTCLIPSPRPSTRVTFGTGPVIRKFLSGELNSLESYNPQAFYDLKEFLSCIPSLYSSNQSETRDIFLSWPESVRAFLGDDFFTRLSEIKENSAREKTFYTRFFRWFNMFRTLKYFNFVHREFYHRLPVQNAAADFLIESGTGINGDIEAGDLLLHLRIIQRESNWGD